MGAMWSLCMNAKDALFPQKQINEKTGEEEEIPRTIPRRICSALFSTCMVLLFLYFFLVGLDLMGNAFKLLSGESAGSLFNFATNPIAGLMVGILATVLVQSSSTTTSIIVAAVGSGALEVQPAIPMIFGSNIGTSVTNTLVSIGFAGNLLHYERAFAGATVHDLFNLLNVALWMILDSISNAINGGDGGILFILSDLIAQSFEPCDKTVTTCEKWEGPVKIITAEFADKIIKVDKDVINDFSQGRPAAELCQKLCDLNKCSYKFARKKCVKPSNTTTTTVSSKSICTGDKDKDKKLKASYPVCINSTTVNPAAMEEAQAWYDDYKLNKAGVWYDLGMTDKGAGTITLILSILLLCICLVGLVKMLNFILRGAAERWVKRALNMNGYLAILVGAGVTIFVQSSSITTSILTPLVAVGALSLEGMVPLTFGANIGTTVTGVLAALVSDKIAGFQIAMVHVLFNVFGVLIWYPVPKIRNIPIAGARNLGKIAARFRPFPTFYVFMVFGIYPLLLLGLSFGFESDSAGAIAGTTIALLIVLALHGFCLYWYKKMGGREKIVAWIEKRNMGFSKEAKEEYQHDQEEDIENNGDIKKAKVANEANDDDDTGSVDASGPVNDINEQTSLTQM